jgi:HAD superfamily hydrolase (TIGR01509 family)
MPNLAAIFDWDGIVVDSSRLHVLTWGMLATELGRRLPEGLRIGSLGIRAEAVITDLLDWTQDPAEVRRLSFRKEELFRDIVRRDGIDAPPGVIRFLEHLRGLRVPCAVGSSAPRLNIEAGMDALGIRPLFAASVAGDEVARGKPAPDIFLRAAEQLGRAPSECVVFEDAPAGVEAAHAAGMRVVGVLTTNPRESLKQADRVVGSFEEIVEADPASWFDRVRT